MSATRGPTFLGDPSMRPPSLPAPFGSVILRLWFTSTVELVAGDRVVDFRPNYDIWVPPPQVRVDSVELPSSWSVWWYPLLAGPHDIEVSSPARETLRVQIDAGVVLRLAYRADITIRKDPNEVTVLGWRSRATLRPNKRGWRRTALF